MGYGDELLGSGLARGAAFRGKRIAFGDGTQIQWHHFADEIYRDNPNVALPGSEGADDLEWVPHYSGSRLYNRFDGTRWIWNYSFKAAPGEIFFDAQELKFAAQFPKGFVLIEPHVPSWKSCAPNKRWQLDRYASVAAQLRRRGHKVRQFIYPRGGSVLPGAVPIKTPSFRHALAVLARAALYIGPEGGLHHGAAAVGVPAVVIFGGFIPPQVTGYATHVNLTGGATEFCGSLAPCPHCRAALDAIHIKHVYSAAKDILGCSTSSPGSGATSGLPSMPNGCSPL